MRNKVSIKEKIGYGLGDAAANIGIYSRCVSL